MNKKIVVGFGEVLWDVLPDNKLLGGAPANFVYHCQHLNAEALVISAIGADDLGQEMLQELHQKGLKTDYIQRLDRYPTSSVTVALDDRGIPAYTIHENVAWDYIQWNDTLKALAQKADVVCFGSLSQRNETTRRTLMQFLSAVTASCLKIFDINLRYPFYGESVIIDSLGKADILKMNIEEAGIVANIFNWETTLQNIVHQLFEKFQLQLIVVTCGEEGSQLFTPDNTSYLKSDPITIADTIGAGDAFTAAIAIYWLQSLPLKEIHMRAADLATFICTKQGAMPDYNWTKIYS